MNQGESGGEAEGGAWDELQRWRWRAGGDGEDLPFGWWTRICMAMRRIGQDRRGKWLRRFISSEPMMDEIQRAADVTVHLHTHTLTHSHTHTHTHGGVTWVSLVASCAALLSLFGGFLLTRLVQCCDGRWRWGGGYLCIQLFQRYIYAEDIL